MHDIIVPISESADNGLNLLASTPHFGTQLKRPT